MSKQFRKDNRGTLYTYVTIILALAAGIFFAFLFMNLIEKIQDAMNPLLTQSQWATAAHYDAFYYAALFINNLWMGIVAFVIFIIAYWAYIYQQRRSAGYA